MCRVKYQNESNNKNIMQNLIKTEIIVLEHILSFFRHGVCINYFKQLGINMIKGQER
jgi:hypothetical protein